MGIDPHHGIGARAIEAAERVCDAAGFEGLANAQLYGRADGSLCLIEINPRVYGTIGFPEHLGLRPMESAVLAALGEDPPAPLDYRRGRRFHRPILEGRWLLAPGGDRDPAWVLPLVVRPWDVIDLVSLTDPIPFAAAVLRLGRGLRSRVVRGRTG